MSWQRFEKYEWAVIAVLFVAYLVGTAALALTYDRQFFLNDALAIVIWLIIGGVLLVSARVSRR